MNLEAVKIETAIVSFFWLRLDMRAEKAASLISFFFFHCSSNVLTAAVIIVLRHFIDQCCNFSS
jgi:hypothetical protein